MFILVLAIAFLSGFFLFWRACRHELFKATTTFDLAVVGAGGALVGGRLVEFVTNPGYFEWQLARLVFFHVWRGFDFYGALAGAAIALFIFAKQNRLAPLVVYDLAAAPLVIVVAVISLGKYLTLSKNLVWLVYFVLNLLIFWVMKRLAKKKRHAGFFACFYLVTLSILDISLFFAKVESVRILGVVYEFLAPIVILQVALVAWYVISGRDFARDLKNVFALSILAVMRIRRITTDANEAGRAARSIIFGPFWFARGAILLLKLVGREIYWGFVDFLTTLGARR